MPAHENLTASRFISRLNLNCEQDFADVGLYTYWCRVAYHRFDRLNMKPQRHSFFELHLCLEGTSEFLLESEPVTLRKGSFLLIPPQKMHTILGASDDFEKFVWGFAPQNVSESEALAKACDKRKGVAEVPPQWYSSVERILNEGKLAKNCSTAIICGELNYLYISLKRSFMTYSVTDTPRKIGIRTSAIRDFISDNIASSVGVGDISAQFYLSERQLERVCAAEYGMTVGELIRSVRAEAIRTMLAETTLSLAEIARLTGFSDRYSMSKFFKKEEGMPPARYRASLLE